MPLRSARLIRFTETAELAAPKIDASIHGLLVASLPALTGVGRGDFLFNLRKSTQTKGLEFILRVEKSLKT